VQREQYDRPLRGVAQPDLLGVGDDHEGAAGTVEVDAVAALEVAHDPAAVHPHDLGVPPGHRRVVDDELARRVAPDQDGVAGRHLDAAGSTGHLEADGLDGRRLVAGSHAPHHGRPCPAGDSPARTAVGASLKSGFGALTARVAPP